MNIYDDQRTVMTLDAGGTNFIFSAYRGGQEIIDSIRKPSNAHDLNLCLDTILEGFTEVYKALKKPPVAISFAFPGPADYESGIIGDLPNLPAFRGGVALGPMLESHFKMPVFINNDGSLFAYGEAIAGYLPYVNDLLKSNKSPKRYSNLVGFTLGTGFGCGIVLDGELLVGDNSIGAEAWLLRDLFNPITNVEESISIRAVRKLYAESAGVPIEEVPEPKDIYGIAVGKTNGDRDAALHAFARMGHALGEAIATVITLVDGIAVLGGGISSAFPAFIESTIAAMNETFEKPGGQKINRLAMKVFNLQDTIEMDQFLRGDSREISVPGTRQTMLYDPMARTGVGVTRLGTSEAIAIGAYAFALNKLS